MHLGEEDSLLTGLVGNTSNTNPRVASPVMKGLAECLRSLIIPKRGAKKPTLILNGDILEMALCPINAAAMVFERFLELTMLEGEPLFGEIVYIPGNHDHHLWEVARETQYVNYMMNVPPGKKLEKPWHISRLFPKADSKPPIAYFLTKLFQKLVKDFDQIHRQSHENLKKFEITVAYPNYGLYSDKEKRCVLFHHGHFIEPIYMLMSHLRTIFFPGDTLPDEVKDIEEENFAWIDFFWSAMGRSGKVGDDVERVYEMMQSPEGVKILMSNLSAGIVDKFFGHDYILDSLEKKVLSLTLEKLAELIVTRERRHTEKSLGEKSKEGLKSYMEGPLYNQFAHERQDDKPIETTFIFGHTHKPYSEDEKYAHYRSYVNVFNSGGWIVESEGPEPLRGGAVILIDEELEAASLRIYNEAKENESSKVSVENATHLAEHPNLLYNELLSLVDPDAEPWSRLSATIDREVKIRRENLKARVGQKDD